MRHPSYRIPVHVAPQADAGYDIVVGSGSLRSLPELLDTCCPAHRYAIVTDTSVEALYAADVIGSLRSAGHKADLFTFASGEAQKTRQTWAEISDAMLAAGFGRDAAVIALGGGVTGDLAGFVAATYMRGLPVVQVPTTLLAMVDASVGGKTGINTSAGKNLIGAFWQPRVVLADPDVLRTLPPEELSAGLAEAVKHAAIADAAHLDEIHDSAEALLRADAEALTRVVVRSVEIKSDFVARDEREAGPRKALNFGHTIAHALEAHARYAMLHGQAVAIGAVVEATLGEALGVTAPGAAERLRRTLALLRLPVTVPAGMTPERILDLTRTDKKARGGRVEYSLIERIGEVSRGTGNYGTPVEDRAVLSALEACRGG